MLSGSTRRLITLALGVGGSRRTCHVLTLNLDSRGHANQLLCIWISRSRRADLESIDRRRECGLTLRVHTQVSTLPLVICLAASASATASSYLSLCLCLCHCLSLSVSLPLPLLICLSASISATASPLRTLTLATGTHRRRHCLHYRYCLSCCCL